MLRQGEGGRAVALQIVTLIALVLKWLTSELVVVLILVAIGALIEFGDPEDRVFPFGDVALIALNFRMAFDERIVGFRVGLDVEQGRLPALDRVTRGAFDSVRTLGELAIVLVLVAVRALGEGEFFLEVALQVASFAFDGLVFSRQRVLGLGVIEGIVESRCRDAFPAAGVVAGGASLVLEAAFVRVSVAVVALAEGKTFIPRRALRVGRVALLAFHFLVKSGQGVARLVVIELARRILPIDEVVALDAIRAEPAFVEILVARRAGLRDPEKRLTEILHLDRGALGSGNLIGRVALIAGEAGVFALEQVARFFVIELIGVPFDKREVHAIVIGVAAYAFLAGTSGYVIGSVQSALGGDPRADVGVAADAAELRLTAADLVAVGAVGGAVECLVRAGQGAGRDLRRSMSGKKNKNEEEENYAESGGSCDCARRVRGETRHLVASNLSMWQRTRP